MFYKASPVELQISLYNYTNNKTIFYLVLLIKQSLNWEVKLKDNKCVINNCR